MKQEMILRYSMGLFQNADQYAVICAAFVKKFFFNNVEMPFVIKLTVSTTPFKGSKRVRINRVNYHWRYNRDKGFLYESAKALLHSFLGPVNGKIETCIYINIEANR